jgi:hypothetical protein
MKCTISNYIWGFSRITCTVWQRYISEDCQCVVVQLCTPVHYGIWRVSSSVTQLKADTPEKNLASRTDWKCNSQVVTRNLRNVKEWFCVHCMRKLIFKIKYSDIEITIFICCVINGNCCQLSSHFPPYIHWRPITVADQSRVLTVFARSKHWNPASESHFRHGYLCAFTRILCLCCPVCR